jgi:hypothetical protein
MRSVVTEASLIGAGTATVAVTMVKKTQRRFQLNFIVDGRYEGRLDVAVSLAT